MLLHNGIANGKLKQFLPESNAHLTCTAVFWNCYLLWAEGASSERSLSYHSMSCEGWTFYYKCPYLVNEAIYFRLICDGVECLWDWYFMCTESYHFEFEDKRKDQKRWSKGGKRVTDLQKSRWKIVPNDFSRFATLWLSSLQRTLSVLSPSRVRPVPEHFSIKETARIASRGRL